MVRQRRAFNNLPDYHKTKQNDREYYVLDDPQFEPEDADFLIGYVGDTSDLTEEDLSRTPPIIESTAERQKYQLTIGTVFINPDTQERETAAFYTDLTGQISANGGLVDDPNRVFGTNFYAWTPPIDYDKHINFGRYFWLSPGAADVAGEYIVKEPQGSKSTIYEYSASSGLIEKKDVRVVSSLPATGNFVGEYVEDASSTARSIFRWNGTAWVLNEFVPVADIPTNTTTLDDGDTFYVGRTGPDFNRPLVWRYSHEARRWIALQVIVSFEQPELTRKGMIWEDLTEFRARKLKLFNGSGWVDLPYTSSNGPTGVGTDGEYIYDTRDYNALNSNDLVWSRENWWRHLEDLSPTDRAFVKNEDQAIRPIIEFYAGIDFYPGEFADFDGDGSGIRDRNDGPLFKKYVYNLSTNEIELTEERTTIYQFKVGTLEDDLVLGFPLSFNDSGEFLFELTLEADSSLFEGYKYYVDTITGFAHSVWHKADFPLTQEQDSDGLFEVPRSITSNADHQILTETSRSKHLLHMSGVIGEQIDFTGDPFGPNNYRWSGKSPTRGSTIIDSEQTLLRAMALLQNNTTGGMPEVIRRLSREYNKALFRFVNRMNQKWDALDLSDAGGTLLVTPEEAVDSILTELFTGRNEQFPYFYADMGTYQETRVTSGAIEIIDTTRKPIFIPPSPPRVGPSPCYKPEAFTDPGGRNVLRGHEGVIITSFGDDRDLIWLNLQNRFFEEVPQFYKEESETFSARFSKANFWLDDYFGDLAPTTTTDPVDDVVVDYNAIVSPSTNQRVFSTSQAEFASYDGFTWLTRRALTDDIFLNNSDGQYYIYNGLGTFEIDDWNRDFDWDYSDGEFRSVLRREFERFILFRTDDFSANTDFDVNNPFTWNYSSAGMEANYRGIYRRVYNTIRPHSHPWEVVGYRIEPTWWRTQYVPTSTAPDGTPRYSNSSGMWSDLQSGIINPITGETRQDLEMKGPIPVDANGELLDPIAAGTVDIGKLDSERIDDVWTYGDGFPTEQEWIESPFYSYSFALAGYLMKNGIWTDTTWSEVYIAIGEDTTIPLGTGPHIIHRDTLTRPAIEDLPIHLEIAEDGSTIQRLGVNAWVSEYVQIIGASPTNDFSRVLKNTEPALAWRTSGFIRENRTDIFLLSSEEIPFDDIHTLLHVSQPVDEQFCSGVQILRENPVGYRVFGYDSLRPFFRVELPALPVAGGQVENRETIVAETNQHVFETEELSLPFNVFDNDTAKLSVVIDGFRVRPQHIKVTGKNTFEIEDVVRIQGGEEVTATVVTTQSNPSTRIRTLKVDGISFSYAARGNGQIVDIEYGRFFQTPQEVINFMIGYGRVLESEGWVFDDIEPTTGQQRDWLFGAKSFATWIVDNESIGRATQDRTTDLTNLEVFEFSPIARKARLDIPFGQNLNVESLQNGAYGILNVNSEPIPADNTFSARVREKLEVEVNEDVQDEQQMFGLRVNITEIQHVVFLSNITRFGDLIYDPVIALFHKTLRVDSYRTNDWQGRLEAPGYIVNNGELIPNFEKNAFDFTRFYDRIRPLDDSTKRDQARNLYGWTPTPQDEYMDAINAADRSRFDYYRGMINAKGTVRPIIAYARGTRLGRDNVFIYEDWAWKLAQFGDTRREIVRLNLDKNDLLDEATVICFGCDNEIFNKTLEIQDYNRTNTVLGTEFEPTFVPGESFGIEVAGKSVTVTLDTGGNLFDTANEINDLLADDNIVEVEAFIANRKLAFRNTLNYTVTEYTLTSGLLNDLLLTAGVEPETYNVDNSRWILPPETGQDGISNLTFPMVPATGLPDISNFDFYAKTYDTDPITTLNKHFHFDPEIGKFDPQAVAEVDLQEVLDPARYNRGPGNLFSNNLVWGEDQVGMLWWDKTRARYVKYRRPFDVSYEAKFPVPDYETSAKIWGRLERFRAKITRNGEIATVETLDIFSRPFNILNISSASNALSMVGNRVDEFLADRSFEIVNLVGNNGIYTVDVEDAVYNGMDEVLFITGVSTGLGGFFVIDGKHDVAFKVGETFSVKGSTGNDGSYTVGRASYYLIDDKTTITVMVGEEIIDSIVDGYLLVDNTTIPMKEKLIGALEIVGIDNTTTNAFIVSGDRTKQLPEGGILNASGTDNGVNNGINNGLYTIADTSYNETMEQTSVIVSETIIDSTPIGEIVLLGGGIQVAVNHGLKTGDMISIIDADPDDWNVTDVPISLDPVSVLGTTEFMSTDAQGTVSVGSTVTITGATEYDTTKEIGGTFEVVTTSNSPLFFQVNGDRRQLFPPDKAFSVIESDENDGNYVVSEAGSSFAAGVTTIPIVDDEENPIELDASGDLGRIPATFEHNNFVEGTEGDPFFRAGDAFKLEIPSTMTELEFQTSNGGTPAFFADEINVELNAVGIFEVEAFADFVQFQSGQVLGFRNREGREGVPFELSHIQSSFTGSNNTPAPTDSNNTPAFAVGDEFTITTPTDGITIFIQGPGLSAFDVATEINTNWLVPAGMTEVEAFDHDGALGFKTLDHTTTYVLSAGLQGPDLLAKAGIDPGTYGSVLTKAGIEAIRYHMATIPGADELGEGSAPGFKLFTDKDLLYLAEISPLNIGVPKSNLLSEFVVGGRDFEAPFSRTIESGSSFDLVLEKRLEPAHTTTASGTTAIKNGLNSALSSNGITDVEMVILLGNRLGMSFTLNAPDNAEFEVLLPTVKSIVGTTVTPSFAIGDDFSITIPNTGVTLNFVSTGAGDQSVLIPLINAAFTTPGDILGTTSSPAFGVGDGFTLTVKGKSLEDDRTLVFLNPTAGDETVVAPEINTQLIAQDIIEVEAYISGTSLGFRNTAGNSGRAFELFEAGPDLLTVAGIPVGVYGGVTEVEAYDDAGKLGFRNTTENEGRTFVLTAGTVSDLLAKAGITPGGIGDIWVTSQIRPGVYTKNTQIEGNFAIYSVGEEADFIVRTTTEFESSENRDLSDSLIEINEAFAANNMDHTVEAVNDSDKLRFEFVTPIVPTPLLDAKFILQRKKSLEFENPQASGIVAVVDSINSALEEQNVIEVQAFNSENALGFRNTVGYEGRAFELEDLPDPRDLLDLTGIPADRYEIIPEGYSFNIQTLLPPALPPDPYFTSFSGSLSEIVDGINTFLDDNDITQVQAVNSGQRLSFRNTSGNEGLAFALTRGTTNDLLGLEPGADLSFTETTPGQSTFFEVILNQSGFDLRVGSDVVNFVTETGGSLENVIQEVNDFLDERNIDVVEATRDSNSLLIRNTTGNEGSPFELRDSGIINRSDIVGVSTVQPNSFDIDGQKQSRYPNGAKFVVINSTGNDGTYTVFNTSYSPGSDQTTIVAVEPIPTAIADGVTIPKPNYWPVTVPFPAPFSLLNRVGIEKRVYGQYEAGSGFNILLDNMKSASFSTANGGTLDVIVEEFNTLLEGLNVTEVIASNNNNFFLLQNTEENSGVGFTLSLLSSVLPGEPEDMLNALGIEEGEYASNKTRFTFTIDSEPTSPAEGDPKVLTGAIDLYEWVRSPVPPSQWVDYVETLTAPDHPTGVPLNVDDPSYVELTSISNGKTVSTYYFWIQGNTGANIRKDFPSNIVVNKLRSPTAERVAWFAPMDATNMLIYQGTLRVEDDYAIEVLTDQRDLETHVEWAIVSENDQFNNVPDAIVDKVLDSLSGINDQGAVVPSPLLNEAEKFGSCFFPIQTIYQNREVALDVYIQALNSILALTDLSRFDPLISIFNLDDEQTDANPSGFWKRSKYIEEEYRDKEIFDVVVTEDERNRRGTEGRYIDGDLVEVLQSGNTDPFLRGPFIIKSANSTTNEFTVEGDVTYNFRPLETIEAFEAGLNNDVYRVAASGSTFDGTDTIIPVIDVAIEVTTGAVGRIKFPVATTYVFQGGAFIEVGVNNHSIEINNNVDDNTTKFRALYERTYAVLERTEQNSLIFSMLHEMMRQHLNCDWFIKTSYISTQIFDKISKSPFVRASEPQAILDNIIDVKPFRTKFRRQAETYTVEEIEDVPVEILEFPDIRITMLVDRLACDNTEDGGWDAYPWDTENPPGDKWDQPLWALDDLGRADWFEIGEIQGGTSFLIFEFEPPYSPQLFPQRAVLFNNGVETDLLALGLNVTFETTSTLVRVILSQPLAGNFRLSIQQAQGLVEGLELTLPQTLLDAGYTPTPSTYEHHLPRVIRQGAVDRSNPTEGMSGCESDDCPGGNAEERVVTDVVPSVNICVRNTWSEALGAWDAAPWDTTPWDSPPQDVGDRIFIIAVGGQEEIPSGNVILPTSELFIDGSSGFQPPYILGSDESWNRVLVEVSMDGGASFDPVTEGVEYEVVEPFNNILKFGAPVDEIFIADGVSTIYGPIVSPTGIGNVRVNNVLLTDTIDYNIVTIGPDTFIDFAPIQPPPFTVQEKFTHTGASFEGNNFTFGYDINFPRNSLTKDNVLVFRNGLLEDSANYNVATVDYDVELTIGPPVPTDTITITALGNNFGDNQSLVTDVFHNGTGGTTTFSVGNNARIETTFVWVNGSYQHHGAPNDYTFIGAGTPTAQIVFNIPPPPGANNIEVRIFNSPLGSMLPYVDMAHVVTTATGGPPGTVDAIPGLFDLESVNQVMVFLNGELKDSYTATGTPEYTIQNALPGPDEIVWNIPTNPGDLISVRVIRFVVSSEVIIQNVAPQAGDEIKVKANSYLTPTEQVRIRYNGWPVGPYGPFEISDFPNPGLYTFSGDNSTDTFLVGNNVLLENMTVFVDGEFQQPGPPPDDDYQLLSPGTLSASLLFTIPPPTGVDNIVVQVDIPGVFFFQGDGINDTFTVGNDARFSNTTVKVEGQLVQPENYRVVDEGTSTASVVFNVESIPPASTVDNVEIRVVDFYTIEDGILTLPQDIPDPGQSVTVEYKEPRKGKIQHSILVRMQIIAEEMLDDHLSYDDPNGFEDVRFDGIIYVNTTDNTYYQWDEGTSSWNVFAVAAPGDMVYVRRTMEIWEFDGVSFNKVFDVGDTYTTPPVLQYPPFGKGIRTATYTLGQAPNAEFDFPEPWQVIQHPGDCG